MENQQIMEEMKPKKPGIGARIGYFFLGWVPMILCIVLQFACAFIIMLPMAVVAMLRSGVDPSDFDAVMEVSMKATMEAAPMGVFLYHIVGILVFGFWYYLMFKKPRPKMFSSFKNITLKSVAISAISGVGLCFFANATVIIEMFVVPSVVESYMKMAETAGMGVNGFVIFATIILAPIGEEFLCRGVIFNFAKKTFPKFWMANCFQALMFGIIHANLVQGIFAFGIGLVLGWLTQRYKSLIPAMIVHFVVNLSSSTWVGYVLAPLPEHILSGVLLLVVAVALVASALIWSKEKKIEME